MSTPQVYKELMVSSIQDLPPTLLAQVANFVYFVRNQVEDPDAFAAAQDQLLLGRALCEFDIHECEHVEAELAEMVQGIPGTAQSLSG